MDLANRFATRTTFNLLRAEYAVALVACSVLMAWHLNKVHWLPAVVLFAYIDVFGYLPGAIAFRRARGSELPKAYYVLYNTMHSIVTQAAVVGVIAAISGFQWAMLAVPIHLCGDRALFGNFVKSFAVPFEPHQLPAFAAFERGLSGRDTADTDAADIDTAAATAARVPAAI